MRIKKYLLFFYLFFVSFLVVSQDMPPEGPPDEEIPIDGGVGLLIAAGIAVGSKMLYKKNKNQA